MPDLSIRQKECNNEKRTKRSMYCQKLSSNILTERCLEYLTLSGLGFSNEEIGDILNVTSSCAKISLKTAYSKLKAANRSHSILIACLNNIITDESCKKILNKYPNAKILLEQKILERECT